MNKKKTILIYIFTFTTIFTIVIGIFYFFSTPSYIPKPYGYSYVVLPAHTYQKLPHYFPYQFEFSTHAILVPSDSLDKKKQYWACLHYPAFQADIYLTYKALNNQVTLNKCIEESCNLAFKHQIRAYAIDEHMITLPNGQQAITLTLQGQVPSQFQFYTTDSTQHFLRGALYFQTALANDSLAPIIDFIKQDMLHMLYTLEWKKKCSLDH